ncbi:MAG TPA: protein kinase [Gemmatimonadales bacterium]|nr:protein kinase [Gemmatimonadales bacterium]
MTADPRLTLSDALADRYHVERELGRGGMAVVYLAHDRRHDRPVALKVLNPELAHALGAERFEREIHVAARLQHPHILTVLDSGEAAGHLWFTMPFIDGESLRSRLARESQLPVDEAVRIAREAADALDYAHRHGIVHRDIKPDNILLSDGHALVADFGIARALAGGGENLTATGASIGTAAYMSPEQAAGERDVDARSDIYSLAIVLYEMLAGATPFDAPTPQATIARRFTEDPAPIRRQRSSVPEHVERALQQALARTAADRFTTARAFADALGAVAVAAAVTTPVATPVSEPTSALARIRRTPAYLALAVGLLIGVGGLFAWSRTGSDADPTAALRAGSVATSAMRIAVLPFENLGDSADGYFADGVTDAVRSKLAGIDGFAVIARASSEDYRSSTKSPAQIADELGVDYLLTGTVRWVKAADGTSRVQVRPELVAIGDGTAETRWGEPFNAPLTDVFEVQEQIAGRVSGALDVALGAPERDRLAERPTADLEAYNLFLQSEAITGNDPASLRRVVDLLERAVARDSSFGLAWARLAGSAAVLTAVTVNAPPPETVRLPLERAMALAPDDPLTFRARMSVALSLDNDLPAAVAIAEDALRRYPNEPNILRYLGNIRTLQNDFDAAIPLLRHAAALDPRNPVIMRGLGAALMYGGHYRAARESYSQAFALQPAFSAVTGQILTWMAEGDIEGARRALNEAELPEGREAFLAYMAMFGDNYWLLDSAQQDTVMRLGVEFYDGDEGSRALVLAQILHARGDTAAARREAARAARDFERTAAGNPNLQIPPLVGLAHEYAGRRADADRWLARARELAADTTMDSELRSYVFELTARAAMLRGDRETALTAIERWVALHPISGGRARIMPAFAPLRTDARFRRATGTAAQR